MKRAILTITATIILLMLCGCRETPTVIIDPVETPTTTTTAPKEEQMIERNLRFTDLIMLNSTTLNWSWLKPYPHRLTSETAAEFIVESNNDSSIQAILFVTFDAATDTVTQADVVYGDVTASMLSDNDLDLYAILRKMAEDEKQ